MSEWKLNTPVALIVFNRPDTTERVFAEIAKAKPPKLLLIGDGPRLDRAGEAEKVAATRAIVGRVDWECEVLTNFSEVNLGCKMRPKTGIDWVFEQVEEAIILEDDCLPHPSFFRFCEEALEKYRHDERVFLISGDNFQFGRTRTEDSYYFSRNNHIWGWASWRRAWKYYDVNLTLWPEVRDGGWLDDVLSDHEQVSYWTDIFQKVADGEIHSAWDYQWTFACWINSALTVLPNVNLISNIGFGQDATHTTGSSCLENLPTAEMVFPLKHPKMVVRDATADAFTTQLIFKKYQPPTLGQRICNKVGRMLGR